MNIFKRLAKLQLPRLGLLPCLAIIFLFSVICLLAALYAQPGSFLATLRIMRQSNFTVFLLNWLPIFLTALFLYFSFGNCALACGLTGAAFGILSVANFYKITLRQAPLMHWDLLLGGEVLGIAQSFDIQMILMIFGFLLILIIAVVLSVFLVRSKRLHPAIRAAGAFTAAICLIVCIRQVYGNVKLYDSTYVEGSIYNETNQFNSRGFIYCFIHKAASSKLTKPAGYSVQEIDAFYQAANSGSDTLSAEEKPHIIMIMSEAFSDFALDNKFDFTGYTNPLLHYSKIRSESISGYITAPNVGGGTADTEFDVLTGINSRHYRTVPYAYNLVRKPIPSLASALKSAGYDNVAIHPGHAWFYNRNNVYGYLGFDSFLNISHFDENTQLKATYVNETATFDAIIREFENHISTKDNPFFDFCVTIQNHGPYFEHYKAEKNFSTSLNLSERDLDCLYNYFHGLADSDRELNRLVDYFRLSQEPVVLVYFGDHLPSLSYEAYDAVLPPAEPGSASEASRLFNVPYIIWSNESAKALVDINAEPAASAISPPYLSALLLDMLGLTELDPYMSYLLDISHDYPILFENRYTTPDGMIHAEEPGTAPALELLRQLEYHRFFEN